MEELTNTILTFIQNSGLFGVFLSCFILSIESIIPIIPLLVFISINFIILGPVLGFILSGRSSKSFKLEKNYQINLQI